MSEPDAVGVGSDSSAPGSFSLIPVLAGVLSSLALLDSMAFVALRLVSAPLGWDEIEYLRATEWVRESLLPYRDFFEHHTPLLWYLSAPFASGIAEDPVGVGLRLRGLAALFWVATAVLVVVLARRERAAWPVVALALAAMLGSVHVSSRLVEFRVDAPMNLLYVAGLVIAERALARHASRLFFLSGVLFGLGCLASQRLVPVAILTTLLYLASVEEGRWGFNRRALGLVVGGLLVAGAALGLLALAGGLRDFWWHNVTLNLEFGRRIRGLPQVRSAWYWLVAFPVKELRDPVVVLFMLGGLAAAVATLRGLLLASLRARLLLLVAVQLVVAATFAEPFTYQHETLWWLLVPLIALAWPRSDGGRSLAFAASAVVLAATLARAVRVPWGFLGASRERQTQALAQIRAHSARGDTVWDGAGYSFGRKPAYRFWFLTTLVPLLSEKGFLPRFDLRAFRQSAPAVVVADTRVALYAKTVAPDVGAFLPRHYLPVDPAVWIPALSARLGPGESFTWTPIRSGRYRVHWAPRLADGFWFENPLDLSMAFTVKPEDIRMDVRTLPPVLPEHGLELVRSGKSAGIGPDGSLELVAGEALTARNGGDRVRAVVVTPEGQDVFFDYRLPGTVLGPIPD